MARSFFIVLFFFTTSWAWSQFDPQFSQNMFNHLATNPGFAGTSGMINLSGLSRQQWMGFEGAPQTTVFGADAALSLFKNDAGLGLIVGNDEIGPFSNLFMKFSYAYRIDIFEGNLGVGLSLGMINQTLDGTTLNPLTSGEGNTYHSPDDPAIPQSKVTGSAFDLGLGAFYEREKYYLGFSVTHLNKPSPNFKGEFQTYMKQTIYLNGGYRYKLKNRPWVLMPSLFIKSDMASVQVDANVNLVVKERFWGGLTYRHQDAIVLIGGLELLNGMRFGYSYDITTSKLASYSSGTHEVMVGYSFDLSFEKRTKRYKSVRYL